MLQDMVNSLEQEQLAMKEALTTSSPIASQLLDFLADDATADLFSEALLVTTSDDVSSSDHTAIVTAIVATDTSAPSCSPEDASFMSADLSMDPDTLSSILNPQPPDPEPDRLMPAISTGSNGYPVPTLQVIQQAQFDQIVSDGFSTAANSVVTVPLPGYGDECLMTARMVSYTGMEPAGTETSCSFMDPVISGLVHQGGPGWRQRRVLSGDGVGSMGPGMGLQEVAEYQIRIHHGMEQLQHVYSTNPADLQAFGDSRQQQQQQLACTRSSPTPVTDMPSLDDSTFKVGRLSAEERKEKIHRYMKKRNERNFSKKIKYVCRKTLADSRPRVRGRFAKNEESGETARPSSSHMEYDDDEEVMVKEEDIFDPSDILQHISGVTSFKHNYTLESWI